MKKVKLLAAFFSMFLLLQFSSAVVHAQCNLYYQVIAEFRDKGWTLESDKYVDLTEGQSCSLYSQYFSSYKTYVVEAFACDNYVTDVDVYLYTQLGDLYMRDNATLSYAILQVNPVSSKYLNIKATNYASNSYYSSQIRILVFSK